MAIVAERILIRFMKLIVVYNDGKNERKIYMENEGYSVVGQSIELFGGIESNLALIISKKSLAMVPLFN